MAQTPSSSSRLLRWLAPALVLVFGAVLALVFVGRSGPVPVESNAPRPAPSSAPISSPSSSAPPPAAAGAAAAAPSRPAAPALPTGQVYIEGKGFAKVVPIDPGEASAPPPSAVDDTSSIPPIEPEKPQTPDWKLEKTARISKLQAERMVRLEKQLEETVARGDKAGAEEQRVFLERMKQRQTELQRDMAALREQVLADGGTLPGAVGETPR